MYINTIKYDQKQTCRNYRVDNRSQLPCFCFVDVYITFYNFFTRRKIKNLWLSFDTRLRLPRWCSSMHFKAPGFDLWVGPKICTCMSISVQKFEVTPKYGSWRSYTVASKSTLRCSSLRSLFGRITLMSHRTKRVRKQRVHLCLRTHLRTIIYLFSAAVARLNIITCLRKHH